jgi:hypothetical protein
MRDVFKFLKDSRKLLESKEPSEASVRAKELGYVYNYGQGTWRGSIDLKMVGLKKYKLTYPKEWIGLEQS